MDHGVASKPEGYNFLNRSVFFDIRFQNGIKDWIGGQTVFVLLIRLQFGCRWTVEDTLGNHRHGALPVSEPSQFVDHGFRHILDNREAPGHVAVERGIAYTHLALVSR